MPTILVIDDNPSVATALELLFSIRKLRTIGVDSPAAALELLEREPIDLVIQDMNFSADTTSGTEGTRLFHDIRSAWPELPIILLTAWTQLENAVELVKAGAADYLAKPWDNRKLLATATNLLALSESRRELTRRRVGESRRKRELASRHDLRGLVFADAAMEPVVALACQVARADVPVLIVGPNGVGKEKIAEIVQANSEVRAGPFVTLNCGALPSELLEAELFGTEAGAYTGATRARQGKFEAADGGTLFLDEIGNLPLGGQMKLLRVLETGRFEPLGSNRERQVCVRVVSATNADPRHDPSRFFSRRPLLSAQHHRDPGAATGRTGRRHPSARRALPRVGQRRAASAVCRRLRGAAPPRMAGQRARAAQRAPARRAVGDGRRDHRRRSGIAERARHGLARAARSRDHRGRARARRWRDRASGGGARAQPPDAVSSHGEAWHRPPHDGAPPARAADHEPTAPGPSTGAPQREPFSLRHSLMLRVAFTAHALAALAVGMTLLAAHWMSHPAWTAALVLALLVPFTAYGVQRILAPVLAMFRALAGTVTSYRDGDYSFSLAWPRRDELGELVDAHNALGDTLREQRVGLVQRELLLDTMVQNTPLAMLLFDARGRVVYANLAARKLLHGGRRMEGLAQGALLASAPEPLRDAVARGGDGLFAVASGEEEEVFYLARRGFRLNGRAHELFVLRHLTAELRRQEVSTWKKVIRVISHELNNSLGPIASLAQSGSDLVRIGEFDQLERAFDAIAERARHLETFIQGYAHFAKLPAPRIETVAWPDFFDRLRRQLPFDIDGALPEASVRFDPSQLEQAILNLLRNAHESGSPPEQVQARVRRLPGAVSIDVCDRGPGMSEAVLSQALIPFYSTKRGGTGLGLALVREIAEAHGGRVGLSNREGGGLHVSLILPQ